jgi:opacity protein-like surface antigen
MIAAMIRRAALVVLLVTACAPASAQTRSIEIFGGYSLVDDTKAETVLPAGWSAGAALTLTPWFAAVGDTAGHYTTVQTFDANVRLTTHAVMGGGRAFARVGRLTEFAQILAGVVRGSGSVFGATETNTVFAYQPGAGVDYPLTDRLAARAQLDVRVVRNNSGGIEGGPTFRFCASLVYRITPR